MVQIILKPHDKFSLLKGESFILKSGKLLTTSIFENGKIINNHTYLHAGEILFNWFDFYQEEDIPEIEIEVEALEDSILEKINFFENKHLHFYQTILLQLIKKSVLETQYYLYDTKGYILTILKKSSSSQGIISRKKIKAEHFNIGKTQFYKIYKEIKEEEFLLEKNGKLYLNLKKINDYLSTLH